MNKKYLLTIILFINLVLLTGCVSYTTNFKIEKIDKPNTEEVEKDINIPGISDNGTIETPRLIADQHRQEMLKKHNYTIETSSKLAGEDSSVEIMGISLEQRKSNIQKVNLVNNTVYTTKTRKGAFEELYYDGNQVFTKKEVRGEDIVTYESKRISEDTKVHYQGTLQFLLSNGDDLNLIGHLENDTNTLAYYYNISSDSGQYKDIEIGYMEITRKGIVKETDYYSEEYIDQQVEQHNKEVYKVKTEFKNINRTKVPKPTWVEQIDEQDPIF